MAVQAVLIVGHYAHHWQSLPVAAWHAQQLFVFIDHRTPLSARQAAIREHVALADIDSFEVFFADRSPYGCEEGAHLWEAVTSHGLIVAGRCERCDHTEIVEPVRAELFVERSLAR